MREHRNPECKAGKCGNCDGHAWDVQRDVLTDCECRCHPHEPEPVECPRCEGTGNVTGDRFLPRPCPGCQGDGVVEP